MRERMNFIKVHEHAYVDTATGVMLCVKFSLHGGCEVYMGDFRLKNFFAEEKENAKPYLEYLVKRFNAGEGIE